jgi:hypothetical protein
LERGAMSNDERDELCTLLSSEFVRKELDWNFSPTHRGLLIEAAIDAILKAKESPSLEDKNPPAN